MGDGAFSHLDEAEDLRPLGNDVFVRGGRVTRGGQDEEALEQQPPPHEINVRTDITLVTSDRLDYNDRLY